VPPAPLAIPVHGFAAEPARLAAHDEGRPAAELDMVEAAIAFLRDGWHSFSVL
jgi:hypothetical protein